VPAYGNYITRANITSLIPVFEAVIAEIHEYRTLNGDEPNAGDLGYTATDGVLDDATDIHPWLSNALIDANVSGGPGCTYTRAIFAIDNNQTGYDGAGNYAFIYAIFDIQSETLVIFFEQEYLQVPFFTQSVFFPSSHNSIVDLNSTSIEDYMQGLGC